MCRLVAYPLMVEVDTLPVCRVVGVDLRGHGQGLVMAPESVLAEHKVGEVLRQALGFMDLHL